MFPLYRTRSSVAFVDDSKDFVDTVFGLMPENYFGTFHTDPSSFEEVLVASAPLLRQEQQTLFQVAEAQNEGLYGALSPLLRFLALPTRFEIVGVAFSDFVMPVITGDVLLGRNREPGLQCVLVTGVADNVVAVQAFNDRQIDAFVPKHSPNIYEDLFALLRSHLEQSAATRGQVLACTITVRRLELLSTPSIKARLQALLDSLDAVEHVLLGKPFGLVVLTAGLRLLWVQLDDEDTLLEQLRSMDELDDGQIDFDRAKAAQAIVARSGVVSYELPLELTGVIASLSPVQPLSEAPFLGAAVFELPQLPADVQPLHHAQWLAAKAPVTRG